MVKNTAKRNVDSFILLVCSNCDCYPAHPVGPASVLIFSGNGETVPAIPTANEYPLPCIGANLLCVVLESGIAAGLVTVIFQVLPVHGYR